MAVNPFPDTYPIRPVQVALKFSTGSRTFSAATGLGRFFRRDAAAHYPLSELSVFTGALKADICILRGGNNADDPVAFRYFGQRLGGVTRDRCVLNDADPLISQHYDP
jgi:hypothetical protein